MCYNIVVANGRISALKTGTYYEYRPHVIDKKNHNKLVVKVLRFAVAIVKFLTISSALDLFIFAFDEKVRRKNEVEWRDFSLYIMCVCFKFSFAVHVSLC